MQNAQTSFSSAVQRPWNAKWIWHPPRECMDNLHGLARRVIELDQSSGTFICHVSCNSLYDLYINGRHVGRGPNPSYPDAQYFDTHDVTQYLRAGENLVAVRCYNFGPTMQSMLQQNPGPGGLILEIEQDGKPIVITDERWKIIQDPSRKQMTEPISGHRGGFKEACDGRQEMVGWENRINGFDDSTWLAAQVVAGADDGPFKLIPREIPPLRFTSVSPIESYFHTCGCTYGGETSDVIHPEALLRDDGSETIVKPMRRDFAPSLIIDFGKGVYGRFEIEFTDGGSGGTVELSYGESLNLTVVDRYVLRPGAQRYSPIERRGGRYLMLSFRGCEKPVHIRRVVCHEQSYPVEPRGHFSCSDALLNRIWEVGKDTSRACMQDHFEDCPWREQTLYTGELVISGVMSYYAWGDQFLARKCLRQFARTQQEDGFILPFGPAPKMHFVLPEYPACWIISIWQHHLHWDDAALVKELWPAVKGCVRWYADRSDSRGFFKRRPEEPNSRFIDNLSNLEADDELAAEQMFYCHALRCASKLAGAIGLETEHCELQRQSDELAKQIERAFWSEEKQCLLDTLLPVERNVTQITNGLAVLWDILPRAKWPALLDVLVSSRRAPAIRAGNMSYHMTEALAHAGRYDMALARIREYWGEMLARGATQFWEVFDPVSPAASWPQRLWSLCHAFCAGAVYSLPAQFAGIRALAPGFSHVQIAPKLADLHWIRTSVPTPRGDVSVMAMRSTGESCMNEVIARVPADVTIDLIVQLPQRDAWNVIVDGNDLPLRFARATLSDRGELHQIHPHLEHAELEANDVRLRFAAANTAFEVCVRAANGVGPAATRITVAEVAGDWRAAPPPV